MKRAGAPETSPRTRPNGRLESRLRTKGFQRIAGVDEVGRGCLFGPVAAAAVILDPARPIRGLDDSKALDPESRSKLSRRIRERALAYAIAAVDAAWIDRVNIYQASRIAMKRAVEGLDVRPDYVLVDAVPLDLEIPQRALIGGDARSFSIAAASIVAKAERDRWLEAWDEIYPEYGLGSNRGYATPGHLEAIIMQGPTPQHRRSFAPVALSSCFPVEIPSNDPQASFPFLDGSPPTDNPER